MIFDAAVLFCHMFAECRIQCKKPLHVLLQEIKEHAFLSQTCMLDRLCHSAGKLSCRQRLPGSNIQINQNEIITARNITKVGHPIGALYGYRIIGIFENEEQLKSLPNYRDSQKVGDYIFKNIDDSDNTITEKDREIIGNPHPEFTYGGNIQLFYKNFDLGITIQGVYGVDVINRDLPTTILSSEIWSVMSKEYYNNRWISPDKPGKYAKAGSNSNTLSRESDLMMQDGSFFRIRDISLGYTLDKKWLTRTFLTNVRVYVSVKNPLLVSKYMGLNPESEGSSNPLNAGVTLGQYPAEKNFVVGASISF